MRQIVLLIMGLWIIGSGAEAFAQANPFGPAPSSALDTLSEAPVGSGVGTEALNRANNLPAANAPVAGAPAPPVAPGAVPPAAGQPPVVTRNIPGAVPAGAGEAAEAIARVARPKIKAIIGERVFDSVSGEMLDDAQVMFVDEAEKEALGLVDDGDVAKGDLVAGDNVWTNVYTTREFISPSNQRLKERLIKAIYTAEQLSPLEFYGYPILTTERHNPAPRARSWQLVPDPRGEGKMMQEVETEKPLQIPKYRDVEQRKDKKIAGQDGWALLFLDEYRIEKGELESDFYPVYIPLPPVPPMVAPPDSASGWKPFPNPAGPLDTPGGASSFSQYGYKVNQPLPNIDGTGAAGPNPYFDKRQADAMLRSK